jgi:hypothetical protein
MRPNRNVQWFETTLKPNERSALSSFFFARVTAGPGVDVHAMPGARAANVGQAIGLVKQPV